MWRFQKFVLSSVLLGCISVASASDKCKQKAQYKFVKSDTVENLLRDLNVSPILGTRGEVAKLIKMYPDILKENGTKIAVGTVLTISFNSCVLPNKWVVENNWLVKRTIIAKTEPSKVAPPPVQSVSLPEVAPLPVQSASLLEVAPAVVVSEELITKIVSPLEIAWNYKNKSSDEIYEEDESNMFAEGEVLTDLVLQTIKFAETSIWNSLVSRKIALEFTKSPKEPSYSFIP